MVENKDSFFSWSVYGALVRMHRTKLGYKNTASFSDGIERRTGMYISKDVLYRIEQSRQVPTAEQFMAINLALFDSISPSKYEDDFYSCINREWREHIENEEMTDAQKLAVFIEEVERGKKYVYSDEGLRVVEESILNEPADFYAIGDSYKRDIEEVTLNGEKFFVCCKIKDYYIV